MDLGDIYEIILKMLSRTELKPNYHKLISFFCIQKYSYVFLLSLTIM